MIILTSDEMTELNEHFASRRDIWTFHESGVWARRLTELDAEDEYGVALKMRNGLPEGLCALTFVPGVWSEWACAEYVEWLLDKYTAYSVRKQVLNILSKRGVVDQLDALSKEICELQGGPFVKKSEKA